MDRCLFSNQEDNLRFSDAALIDNFYTRYKVETVKLLAEKRD